VLLKLFIDKTTKN